MTDLLERARAERPRIDPRIAQRWVDVRRQQGRRRLRMVVAGGAVLGLLALADGLVHTSLVGVRHVRVTMTAAPGAATPPTARIVAEAGLAGRPPMIDVSTASVAARLDADPYLGGARAEVRWPATVTVTVGVRAPVAQARAGSRWALVDPTGRVLADSAAQAAGLPVLQGFGSPPGPGGWLAGSLGPSVPPGAAPGAEADLSAPAEAPDVPAPATAALVFLQSLPPMLRSDVQTVTTGPGAGLALVVVPPRLAAGTAAVQLGDGSQLGAKETALVTVLGQADLSGVQSIDLSVPDRPATVSAGAPPQAP